MVSKFIHLHLHTKYSVLDGMCKFEKIAEAAKANRMFAAALTDHGNMYGVVEFYDAMRRAGIKPIIGMEAYLVDDVKNNTRKKSHLVLLAKSEEGYKNLMALSSFAFVKGFYYKPTIDKNILKDNSKGLIALSSCIQGEVPAKILENDYEGAKEAAEFYLKTFGEGNFYLELQNHGLPDEEAANRGLRQISKELSIPAAATNDTHYMSKDDAKAHEVLMCIQTGKTLNDSERMNFESDQFYFKNYDEMKAVLPDDIEAIERTFDIAEKCNFDIPKPPAKRPYYMPSYEIKNSDDTYEEYFEKFVRSEFEKKYKNASKEITDRIEHEIKVIKKQGYSGYFLIVKDIVDYAKNNDIPVGPGRGSAAGSLAAYVLGITSIDPIKYKLLFERFLNPERVSPPDIDIDFSDEDRGRIIEFIVEKFGKDKVAQIITFQTLKPRQAIRDTGRVLDVPLPEVDALAKHVPEGPGMNFEAILKDENFVAYVNSDKTGKREEIISYALKIEGLLRQDSTHAAGVVIAPDNLTRYIPIAVPKSKEKSELNYMTQYPMESLEKIGLLKFDILGLRNLSIIKRAVRMVKENTGRDVVLEESGFDNPEVYKLLGEGNTNGVFQLESSGMRDMLKKIEPSCFEDIIAVISLFRPGPMRMIDDYIKRKKGIEKIKYDMPELEAVLKDTYGIAVYQEQVMQIAVEVAGFSLAKADLLRRIMGKKKVSDMEAMRREFLDGAAARGVAAGDAERLFEKLEQFSQYGFN
ncbi:MAG TPA: DNA polymerase III subunit alpha, partial [Firmicutes bacterium]|nr:DNA polymerase III subunit alpha [Bacillota bacterium]